MVFGLFGGEKEPLKSSLSKDAFMAEFETTMKTFGIEPEKGDKAKDYDKVEATAIFLFEQVMKVAVSAKTINSKNDIESLETTFKNKQKKINELIEENSNNLEKIKKENINIKNRIETIENITKETSTIFVTKVADLADHVKKLDKRSTKNENYSNELSSILESIKTMFEQEKNSLSKIISNLKDEFIDLHERCDHTLNTVYRNDTQHIIDKYVFELSQLNVMFESTKTMQRENNYFKCIGNLSNRLDKIEQKIT